MPNPSFPETFDFNPKDFSGDGVVEAMTTEGVGAYILLLCKAWYERPPGSLPADDSILARWSRLDLDRWSDCRAGVLAAFTLGTDGRYHQKRMRIEFDKLRNILSMKSLAGAAGAEKRWGKHRNGCAIADAWQTHSTPNAVAVAVEEKKPSPPSPSPFSPTPPIPSPTTPVLSSPTAIVAETPDVWGKTGHIRFNPVANSWLGITVADREAWSNAYPAVDIELSLNQMISWLMNNPTKARKSNYGKFITRWLQGNQDRGGNRYNAGGGAGAYSRQAGATTTNGNPVDRRAAKAAAEYPEPDRPLPITQT